jgi:membrane-bound lytic murein transglycosylase D
MGATNSGGGKARAGKRSRAVLVRVVRGRAKASEARFTGTFVVGRSPECELQVLDEGVSPNHLQVMFDGVVWWLRDLSNSGTFMDGKRLAVAALRESAEVELGQGGPRLALTLSNESTRTDAAAASPPASTAAGGAGFTSEQEIIERYARKPGKSAGHQTQMFQRAFELVQKKSSRNYRIAIGAAALVLIAAGGVIFYQARRLNELRATAERLFYTTRSVDLEIAKLEDVVVLNADPHQLDELMKRRAKLKQMEKEYDAFVQELGVYKVSEDERIILRVARTFGECEVNVPKGFVNEVRRYVHKLRARPQFAQILKKARDRGYAPVIERELLRVNLPPQFIFLPMQESAYDEHAVGPPTRYGYAKGMWQFIAPTGQQYGLHIGPHNDQAACESQDERCDWAKETKAAVKYIRDLVNGQSQGSGLLAMASYNWNEARIRKIISDIPETPRERNFWRLLGDKNIPAETYDYVFSIFTAAVICENPPLFGFDVTCPLGSGAGSP